jgi:polyphosphate glucokinase
MRRKGVALGVDIGGSGIKAGLVDVAAGSLLGERRRVPTPRTLAPKDVLAAVVELARGFEPGDAPMGVGFPAVVVGGTPRSGFTAHHVASWIGYPVEARLSERSGRRVTLINDADAAGIAEMRFGKGLGKQGVVLVLTLGTGIGSALFVDGRLVPNTELGNLYLKGRRRVAERAAAADARERERLSWPAYAARLGEYLQHVERLLSPDLVILGGGISKRAAKFLPLPGVKARVVAAKLRNRAGIIGAALAASGASAPAAAWPGARRSRG